MTPGPEAAHLVGEEFETRPASLGGRRHQVRSPPSRPRSAQAPGHDLIDRPGSAAAATTSHPKRRPPSPPCTHCAPSHRFPSSPVSDMPRRGRPPRIGPPLTATTAPLPIDVYKFSDASPSPSRSSVERMRSKSSHTWAAPEESARRRFRLVLRRHSSVPSAT